MLFRRDAVPFYLLLVSVAALRLQAPGSGEAPAYGLSALLRDPDAEGTQTAEITDDSVEEIPIKKIQDIDLKKRGDKSRILWTHLHNEGGTFVCQEARLQGERTAGGISNCNIGGDKCTAHGDKRLLRHCDDEGRRQQTFSSLEREVFDADFACDDMLYGIMLRNPLSAMQSTKVTHELRPLEINDIKHAISSQNLSFVGSGHPVFRRHPCLAAWDTYQHFDNFQVRTLSGNGNYFSEPGKMNRTQLEQAKARLDKYDVILILEDLADHIPQLSKFGWDLTLLSAQGVRKNAHYHGSDDFSESDLAFFTEANQLDLELYEYARSLAARLTRKAKNDAVTASDAGVSAAVQN